MRWLPVAEYAVPAMTSWVRPASAYSLPLAGRPVSENEATLPSTSLPASTTAIDAESSAALAPESMVVGGSCQLTTCTWRVAAALVATPSLTVKLAVRTAIDGFSLVLV